jgi:hypothetical protein
VKSRSSFHPFSFRFLDPWFEPIVNTRQPGRVTPHPVAASRVLVHEYTANGIYTAELHDASGRLGGTLTFEIPNHPFSPRLVAANPAMRVPSG